MRGATEPGRVQVMFAEMEAAAAPDAVLIPRVLEVDETPRFVPGVPERDVGRVLCLEALFGRE